MLALLLCAALSADVAHRIELELRSRLGLPGSASVALGEPRPGDLAGYDRLPITITSRGRATTQEYYLSADRKTLLRVEKLDLSRELMSRLDLAGRPVRGDPAAKVTLVAFVDYQCPYCARMSETLPALLAQYPGKIKLIYKDYPITGKHHWAMHAAQGANCLAEQSGAAFWEQADYLLSHQEQIGSGSTEKAWKAVDAAVLERAGAYQLDVARLRACMAARDEVAIRASEREGEAIGVEATPTLYINGFRTSGSAPIEELKAIIDRALSLQSK